MTLEEIRQVLEKTLTSNRYRHSLGVMETAEKLAAANHYDRNKAALAGLLHDCARDLKGPDLIEACSRYRYNPEPIFRAQPELLHGPLGALMLKPLYGIDDPDIMNAVKVHTTGCESMNLLDRIIFLADYIEPNRNFPGVEQVRELAWKNLDDALLLSMNSIIKHIMDKPQALLHPDTIAARNHILLQRSGLLNE